MADVILGSMNLHLTPAERLALFGALVAAYMFQVKLDNREVMTLAQQSGVLVTTQDGEDGLAGSLTKGTVRYTRTIEPAVREMVERLLGRETAR